MNSIIAIYSGALQMIIFPNNYYLKNVLKASPARYTNFQSYTQAAWILKPLFGFLSDTFYPFKSKIRFYLIFICSMHFLISAIFFFFKPGYESFTLFVFLIYFCTGFADALGEGMTAVITKMEIRLGDLKTKEEKAKMYIDDIERYSVGTYFVSRMTTRAIGTVIGGLLAEHVSISTIYIIFAVFPILVIIWSSLMFREVEVSPPIYHF